VPKAKKALLEIGGQGQSEQGGLRGRNQRKEKEIIQRLVQKHGGENSRRRRKAWADSDNGDKAV